MAIFSKEDERSGQRSLPQERNYLDWAVYQPRKTWGGGGGAKWLSPNLAISSQMTMKLEIYLWVKIFTN